MKKGISLIVLVITIIVIIILAGAIILNLTNNNPIDTANKSVFQNDVKSFQEELTLRVLKEKTDINNEREKITTTDYDEIRGYIPSFKEKYRDKLYIFEDEVVYSNNVDDKEKDWLKAINIKSIVEKGTVIKPITTATVFTKGTDKQVSDFFTIIGTEQVSYKVNGNEINNLNELDVGENKIICSDITNTVSASVNLNIIDKEYAFSYTGDYQIYEVKYDGIYKLECWGASGGASRTDNKGGYTSGNIGLLKGQILYIYVGEEGNANVGNAGGLASYNGGGAGGNGSSGYGGSYSGGGATDIRLVQGLWNNTDSLASRIMVAGARWRIW